MKEIDLVTGATGFIGRHLTERLVRDGRSVRILCRKGSERKLPAQLVSNLELSLGDLRDRDSLFQATHGASRVFHCAGHVSDWGADQDFFAMNVQGTRWLLEGALEARAKRFIHLSSIAAFGTPAPKYFDDHSKYGDSKDPYSRTKVEGEKVVFDFHTRTGLPITVLRPAVVYGPHGTWLEEPIRMIEKGKMFLLGGGIGTCHPCYIENLIDAVLIAAEHPRAVGQGYIVSDGESISFKDYFNALAEIAGKGPIRRSIPLSVARTMAGVFEGIAGLRKASARPLLTQTAIDMVCTTSETSTRKIREELGFQPRYDFHSAIEALRGWYQQNRPKAN